MKEKTTCWDQEQNRRFVQDPTDIKRKAREYNELHKNEFDNLHKINYIKKKMWYLVSELQKKRKKNVSINKNNDN